MSVHGSNATNGSIFSINGRAVVIPATINYVRSDLDSSNTFTTITGKLQRDRITVKRKLECSWSGLSADEMAALLQSMSNVFFPIHFIDPYTGAATSMVAYVGDRTSPTAFYDKKSGQMIFESFSANFIEQ